MLEAGGPDGPTLESLREIYEQLGDEARLSATLERLAAFAEQQARRHPDRAVAPPEEQPEALHLHEDPAAPAVNTDANAGSELEPPLVEVRDGGGPFPVPAVHHLVLAGENSAGGILEIRPVERQRHDGQTAIDFPLRNGQRARERRGIPLHGDPQRIDDRLGGFDRDVRHGRGAVLDLGDAINR